MTDETYQGYANRETWALLLWVGNDQGLYNSAVEWATAALADLDDDGNNLGRGDDDGLGSSATDYALGWRWLEQTDADWTEYEEDGNTTREFRSMRREIGSWWRIDATEVGAFLRELVENES